MFSFTPNYYYKKMNYIIVKFMTLPLDQGGTLNKFSDSLIQCFCLKFVQLCCCMLYYIFKNICFKISKVCWIKQPRNNKICVQTFCHLDINAGALKSVHFEENFRENLRVFVLIIFTLSLRPKLCFTNAEYEL